MELFSTEILTELSLVLGLFGVVIAIQYFFLEHSLSKDIESLGNRIDNLENRMDNLENRMERVENKIDSLIVHLLEKRSPGDI